jgi:hypothetical protein
MDKCIRQRARWPIVAAFVIQAALSAPAAVTAATLQVSLSGVDVGNCTAVACLHISYAIGQANDGDTITIAAGTYGDSNLVVAKSITIAGAGPATTKCLITGRIRLMEIPAPANMPGSLING